MRKVSLLLLIFFCPLGLENAVFGQIPDTQVMRLDGKPDLSDYKMMVAKIKSGDPSIDFVKLRAAYLDWVNDECNVTEAPQRDVMVKAFEAKDYAKAVLLAQPVLDYEYVNRSLHLAISNAYKELGNSEKSDFHKNIADLLMKALLASGDGKTAKTAYRVQSIREEYQVMSQLGFQVSTQSLVFDKELGSFDVLSGKDKNGEQGSFYFDINGFWVGSTASKPCKDKKK